MGKIEEQTHIEETQIESSHCKSFCARINKAFSSRCVFVLILSLCVLLSAIFWLPSFHPFKSGSEGAVSNDYAAPVQASFQLERPVSLLSEHIERLEYEILGEIGMPNTQVSIISMQRLGTSNWTYVLFGVFPNPYNVPIPLVALSLLKSSLVELVLRTQNLLLTPSIFGLPSSFEIVKFLGGLTVIPAQSGSFFQKAQFLFNFTLNNSISQIKENIDQLKGQLKFGLQLRPDENVYVQVTNLDGSTLAPPIIVQATVLSDVGTRSLLPQRLKQLAQAIADSHSKNLGLDHAVFGKVKQIQLSAYLQNSLDPSQGSPSPSPSPFPSPSPSPSPSPAPSEGNLYFAPISQSPTFSPSFAPTPKSEPQPPLPPSCISHAPPMIDIAPSPRYNPYHPPAPSGYSTHVAVPTHNQPPSPVSQLDPHVSPLPSTLYSPSPREDQRSGKSSPPSMVLSHAISPFPSSFASGPFYRERWLIGLLGFVLFHLL